jgi:ADP-ribose pyrophosphatase YjhB (NUDIX family)
VDLGESPEAAALRETREEVGIAVSIGPILGIYTDPANPIAAVVVYLAQPAAGQPTMTDEALQVDYFGPRDIPWSQIAFPTTVFALRDWIKAVQAAPET